MHSFLGDMGRSGGGDGRMQGRRAAQRRCRAGAEAEDSATAVHGGSQGGGRPGAAAVHGGSQVNLLMVWVKTGCNGLNFVLSPLQFGEKWFL